jgi:hypothetical protein
MATVYDFPTHRKGDTIEPIIFTITVNGAPLDLTGATAKMDVRKQTKLLMRYTTSVNRGLTILDPATDGKLQFDRKVVNIAVGTHQYDIEFTLADSSVKTYISGDWIITSEQTYD